METKIYCLQLMANETMLKGNLFATLTQMTGYCGVNPDYPYVYVVYRTSKERNKAFKTFKKHFDHCKVVANVGYCDEKYLSGGDNCGKS